MAQADEVAQCSPRVTTVEKLVIGSFLLLVHEYTNLGMLEIVFDWESEAMVVLRQSSNAFD